MGVTLFSKGRLAESGIDWVTATAREGDQCEELLRLGESIATAREACGFSLKKTGFQGYAGYGVDGCFYGTRQDGACLRVSGRTAHQVAGHIADLGLHVTRCDLQITVDVGEDDTQLARRFIDAYRTDPGRAIGGRQCATKLVDSADAGSSAYIGARDAAFFGRVYDKHRESSGGYPAGYWRVESECKRESGSETFYRLAGHGFSGDATASIVRDQWRKRGISIGIPLPEGIESPQVSRKPTDVERKLRWLESVVSKVTQDLHARGYHDEATRAIYGWLMPEGD